MAQAAQMMNTLLVGQTGTVTPEQFRKLRTAAGMDNRLDAGERQVFGDLAAANKLAPTERTAVDSFLKTSPQAPFESPELAYMRGKNPVAFAAQVNALKSLAQPGDVILWRTPRHGAAAVANDQWAHASLALPNGRFLDTMDAEGASITTADVLVAKGTRRIKQTDFVIARPKTPLSPDQLHALDRAAHQLQGRGFSFLTPVGDAKLGNCSGSVYDVFKAAGVDLAPLASRQGRPIVSPSDLTLNTRPVASIDLEGNVQRHLPYDFVPKHFKLRGTILGLVEKAGTHCQGLWNAVVAHEQEGFRHVRLG